MERACGHIDSIRRQAGRFGVPQGPFAVRHQSRGDHACIPWCQALPASRFGLQLPALELSVISSEEYKKKNAYVYMYICTCTYIDIYIHTYTNI